MQDLFDSIQILKLFNVEFNINIAFTNKKKNFNAHFNVTRTNFNYTM